MQFRTLILFLCLYCCQPLPEVLAQQYRDYHLAINNAEAQLVLGHTDSALHWYRTAFRQYTFIFAKDAANAAQIALHSGRSAAVDSFLLKGAGSGLRPDCLDAIPLLQHYFEQRGKDALRVKMIDSNEQFARTLRANLALDWHQRYQMEQQAKNAQTIGNDAAVFERYRSIVRDNVRSILSLWQTSRIYPGDRIMGLGDDCSVMGDCEAFYSLAHYDCSASTFGDALWQAVDSGMLHPREFGALWEFEALRKTSIDSRHRTSEGVCNPQVKKFNLTWFHATDSASVAEAAANRERYWICSAATDSAIKVLERTEHYKLRFNYH